MLRRLGATLEDCRTRSLQRYFEIKVIIAETELLSIHQQDLRTRPGEFGADFRSRVLPAVLFTANDYVQATREHRRMVTEMAPLYRQYDAFITAGQGEAARLDAHRSLGFWQRDAIIGSRMYLATVRADGPGRRGESEPRELCLDTSLSPQAILDGHRRIKARRARGPRRSLQGGPGITDIDGKGDRSAVGVLRNDQPRISHRIAV